MTTIFKLLDLSTVPVPDIITSPDFETKYQELKALLLSFDAAYEESLQLESDPLACVLQAFAYRELLLEAKINDATRANMLASASGADLDGHGARYNMHRAVVSEATAMTEAVLESDDSFRRRIQMSFDSLNTAGSEGSYLYHALSSSVKVLDADATSPSPCHMILTILSHELGGVPSQETLIEVRRYFGLTDDGMAAAAEASAVRPLGDYVQVQAADVHDYDVVAELTILPGPSADVIRQTAEQAVRDYVSSRHRLGYDVPRSGLFAALHCAGVHNVRLISPMADLVMADTQAAYCTEVTVSVVGIDE